MAQIKSKQIQLIAQGDLIVGNATADGTPLTVGTINQVLVSNGTTPLWGQVPAAGINLTEGDVFIGDATNTAVITSATAQGQVIVSGAGPNFDFAVGNLTAQYITFAPNITQNISSTNVQTAITEVASGSASVYTSAVDPSVNNDGVDTALLGTTFKIGDMWINTVTDNIWHAVDVGTGVAVWVRGEGVSSTFVYKGDVDASNIGVLPATPVAGDWWRVGVTGGTKNFNGLWDIAGEPNGAIFEIGDSIVYGDNGNWHKIDNTDPTVTAGNGVTITGSPSYIAAVNADEATITATGGLGTEIAVYGGLANQHLIGQGATSDAIWGYQDNLYDSGGNIIVDGVGSITPVNHIRITNSNIGTNVSIASVGTDLNIGLDIIAKGTGRISLDSTLWPDASAPARSIPVALTAGNLSWIAAPDLLGDQVLMYNDTTNVFEWANINTTGGVAWGTIVGDTGIGTADTISDILTIIGGDAITTTAADNPENLTIDLNVNKLTIETVVVPSIDYFVFYDVSAGVHRKTTLDNIFTSSSNGQVGQDEVSAIGGVNEAFLAFFTNVPLSDTNISIYFNGLELRSTGWSRAGTTLTLVDLINGYQADAGDIITARYEY